MLFVLDWEDFAIVFLIGVFLALGVYFFLNIESNILTNTGNIISTTCNILWVIVVAILFSRKKELLEEDRQKTLRAAGGAIAHEMRTPLANVSMSGQIIKNELQKLRQAYPQADPSVSVVDKTSLDERFSDLEKISTNLTNIAKRSQSLINLLLMNLNQELGTLPHSIFSMRNATEYALEEFAYHPHERGKVHLTADSDFFVKGNKEIVTHLFFNLLKNSFYFIHACGKGEIFITLKSEDDKNTLIFKDTGPGIEKHHLSKIFTPFYSKRPHGTGIGLSFCKRAVESMGGNLQVMSEFGNSTTFIIHLPKVKKTDF